MNMIILAAGKNTRLDNGLPKSMLEIGGETLLERHLRLFSHFGVNNFCIVTGYRHEMLEGFIESFDDTLKSKITLAHNPRFDLANGRSLLAAHEWVTQNEIGEFFFTMADHFFSPEFVEAAMKAIYPDTTLTLVVDAPSSTNAHIDLDDVTRVQSAAGLIQSIAKHLEIYDFYDTGLFFAKKEMFELLAQSIQAGENSISNMVQLILARHQASVMEVSGHFWNDVDTPEDLKFMRNLTDKLS